MRLLQSPGGDCLDQNCFLVDKIKALLFFFFIILNLWSPLLVGGPMLLQDKLK